MFQCPPVEYDCEGNEIEQDYNNDYESELKQHKNTLKVFNFFVNKIEKSDLCEDSKFNHKDIKKKILLTRTEKLIK